MLISLGSRIKAIGIELKQVVEELIWFAFGKTLGEIYNRAKLVSDYVGMLTRVVFLSVIIGYMVEAPSDELILINKITKIAAIIIMIVIAGYLSAIVSLLSSTFVENAKDVIIRSKKERKIISISIINMIFFIMIFFSSGIVISSIKFGAYQASRLHQNMSGSENELKMPPRPEF